MKEEYTQQTINRFYAGFKKLPNGYNIEKVHQLINNPYAEARHKVNLQFNYLKLIIMTSTILIGLSALFLWIKPLQKTEEHLTEISTLKQNKEIQIKPDSRIRDKNKIAYATHKNQNNQKTNENKISQEYEKNDNTQLVTSEKTDKKAEQITTPLAQKTAQDEAKETIDGNKYILDLTFDELRNLGFNISHYSVFYRNSDVIFYSMHDKLKFGYQTDPASDAVTFNGVSHDLDLQNDTFSQITNFLYLWNVFEFDERVVLVKSDTFNLEPNNYNFYPSYTTELDGTTKSVFSKSDFEQQNDTLVPIVLRFSQLNTGRTKDLIFWFTPTSELFEKLPDRYSWLKSEYDGLKEAKVNNPLYNYVKYDIDKWVKDQLFSEKINGENFIITLNDNELEKIGGLNEKTGASYSFKTIIGEGIGKATGSQTKMRGNKPPIVIYDTTFYTDYVPIFNTLSNGFTRRSSVTSRELDKFLTENDKTLPVLVKNPDWQDIILWFSLSENFWKLIPARYQYLKSEYDKILFNKSFYPDKDLIQYFPEPFKKMDINVKTLDLNKKELENIGFMFNQNELSIDCALNQSWIKYESIDYRYKYPDSFQPKRPPETFLKQYAYFKSPNGQFIPKDYLTRFDSILINANQGFLPLGITDTLGRVLNIINLNKLEDTVKNINSDLLIPILIKESKYFSEYAEDKILWFTPTEELIKRLPERYRTDLQNEIEQIRTKSASACNYFEICKSTLELENLKVYPNPAGSSVTIEFEANEALTGSISIVGITGSIIKELVPETTFSSGFNVYQTDLSGIAPGIYLVYISTKNGFKTQRLIVSP